MSSSDRLSLNRPYYLLLNPYVLGVDVGISHLAVLIPKERERERERERFWVVFIRAQNIFKQKMCFWTSPW